MSHCLYMFRLRDQNLVKAYTAVNKDDRYYKPFLPTKFLPPQNAALELPLIPLFDEKGLPIYHRVFIPFKPSDNADVDDWSSTIINFTDRSLYYIDSRPTSNIVELAQRTEATTALNELLVKYEATLIKWISDCPKTFFGPIHHLYVFDSIKCRTFPYSLTIR